LFCTLLGGALPAATSARAAESERDRSPVDLVLAPDESWLVTANQTSDTVSLVRIADGVVLDELAVGRRPVAVVLHPDGKRVLVSSSYSGELQVLAIENERLTLASKLHLGFQPHGIALTADGRTAYVALADADQIAVVDLPETKLAAKIDVGRWPRYLALSPDGKRLAAGTSGDRGVSLVDVETRQLLHVDRFVGLNIGHMQVSRDGRQVYFPWMVYRKNPISAGNIRLGWVLASRLGRTSFEGTTRREALSLDPPGKAVADPHGLALTANEEQIVVSAAGTHELLVFRVPGLPFLDHGGTDHIDEPLLKDTDRFFRIEVGGRPMGLRIGKDDRTVYVANYLDNSVQVVDLQERQVVRRIALGGPEAPSLARRGEAIFYDARRSLDQWYSCHSCHADGGSNAVAMDTVNDGTRFTFKTVLPLYQLDQTPPWTWHGWQRELPAAMKHSMTTTMLGPEPNGDDVEALIAYLQTLEPPPNPYRRPDGTLSEAAERGRRVFESDKAACITCHSGPRYTDGEIHEVGLGSSGDAYKGFNTPSLVGVFRKVQLLHDGRSASLEELLTGPHAPAKVAGSELSADELSDLIAYLKSL
jgi:YVTN family beta-propeller protein